MIVMPPQTWIIQSGKQPLTDVSGKFLLEPGRRELIAPRIREKVIKTAPKVINPPSLRSRFNNLIKRWNRRGNCRRWINLLSGCSERIHCLFFSRLCVEAVQLESWVQ